MRLKDIAGAGARNKGGNLLRITLFAGLFLLILSGGVLTVFFLLERSVSKNTRIQDSFYRILHEYDVSASIFTGTEKEFEKLNDELNRLEKRAIGVESWLSVLKRRRILANRYPPSRQAYKAACFRALEAYPQSEPLAAIAAAAFVKDSALNKETQEELRNLLPMLPEPAFNTLRLGLHVLLGDFKNVQTAQNLPDDLHSNGIEDISIDLALLRTLRADYNGATAQIQGLINSYRSPSKNSLAFAAEYTYDFGDLRRAAELFSIINDEDALVRAADALYLAGYTNNARTIWSLLANTQNKNSLYNLAVTAEDSQEAATYLERLVKTDSSEGNPALQFGLIRYSRLLDNLKAAKVLEKTENLKPSDYPFIDLELCKRNSAVQERARQLANAWLLLDRHPENEDLYHWAAWFMFFQRYSDEADILLRRAEQFNFNENWPYVYRALYFMEIGNLEKTEELLQSALEKDEAWYIYANLGRIFEAQLSFSRAVEQYEKAALLAINPKAASRIAFRLSKCYSALGRPLEMIDALRAATDLDPDNHAASLDLDRALR